MTDENEAHAEGIPWDDIPEITVGETYKFKADSGDAFLDAAEPWAVATLDETALLAASGAQMLSHHLAHFPDDRARAAFMRSLKALAQDDLEGMAKAAIAAGLRLMDAHAEMMIEDGVRLDNPGVNDRAMFAISAMMTVLRTKIAIEAERRQAITPSPPIP